MNKGERLRYLRESLGLSQVEAAEKIGISKQTLYKYEKNIITNIPYEVIERIVSIYKTTPSYIFGWDEETEKEREQIKILTKYLEGLMDREKNNENSDNPIQEYLSLFSDNEEEIKEFIEFYKAFKNLPKKKRDAIRSLL